MDSQTKPPIVSKWLWMTFIIVFLIGAVFAAWYYMFGPGKTAETTATTTTTSVVADATAGWSTFNSDTFGYSIKYPLDWNYKTASTITTFAPKTVTEDFILGISVKTDSLATVIQQQKDQFASNSTFKEQGTATVGGQQATTLTFTNNADKTIVPVVYLIFKNNYVYLISGQGGARVNDEATVKLMINTFKFTTASAATADWKTYTNTKYGYTIKYPSHLAPGIAGTTAVASPTGDNAVFSEGGNSKDQISISVETGKTIDQLVAETKANDEKNYNTVTVTDATIGGQPAKKIVYSNPKDAGDFGDTTIYVQKGSNIFWIYSDSNLPDFETILTTFQFTK